MGTPGTNESPARFVVATFCLLGAFWGCWAMALPDIQRAFHLSDAALGVVLAIAVGAAGFAGAIVARLARHFPSLRLLAGIVIVWAVTAVPPSLARSATGFAIVFAFAQIAAGCVDAGMNAPATVAFSDRPGSLVRFHSLFNVGALVGAIVASIAMTNGASWRWLWPAVAVLAVCASLFSYLGPPGDVLDAASTPHSPTIAQIGEVAPSAAHLDGSLRRDGLLGFLVVFALAEVVEGGAFTWGVLYLRHHLHAGLLVGAGAYAFGHSVAAVSRYVGGASLRSTPVTAAFAIGSLISAVGLITETSVPSAVVAAVGLTLAAAGTSLIWPLAMSTVAERATRPAQAVGTFTAAGYVGWVAGAPVIGLISDRIGAKAGLWFMALVCVLVAGAVTFGAVPRTRNKTGAPVG